ncbi:hypothetical protein Tco_0291183 [Tanacetum coccineum]
MARLAVTGLGLGLQSLQVLSIALQMGCGFFQFRLRVDADSAVGNSDLGFVWNWAGILLSRFTVQAMGWLVGVVVWLLVV